MKNEQSQISSAAEIIESMEQGILVWSASGHCLMHNDRIIDFLELRDDDIFEGCARSDFLTLAVKRGEITEETAHLTESQFQQAAAFAFDRHLPSGRVVTTNARPLGSGGFVVTFTDITAAKQKEAELADAKVAAEKAELAAKRALESQRTKQQELGLLAELDEWLQSCKSLNELYRVVTDFMAKLLPDTSGELYIYSNSRDMLDAACHWNCDRALDHIQPDSCWALRRGRPYEFGTGTINLTCSHVDEQNALSEVQNYLCVPIVAHGDTVGLLNIKFLASEDSPLEKRRSSSEFAKLCAEHISLAIANVKLRDELRDQSIRDVLTGLYNRRYFLEAMRVELNGAHRDSKNIGLVSFDADHFKTFNDNHGHDAGDIVLRAIGDAVRAQFDTNEVACRYGGEEFSILVPNASMDDILAAAETLRSNIENLKIRYGGSVLPPITISAGVAIFPADGRLPQDLLKAADKALYAAKSRGRNQIAQA